MEVQTSAQNDGVVSDGSELAAERSQHTTSANSLQSKISGDNDKIVSSQEPLGAISSNVIQFGRAVHVSTSNSHLAPDSEESSDEREFNPTTTTSTKFHQSEGRELNTAGSQPEQQERQSSVESKFNADLGGVLVDDRRIRRQIANCNERRRMQSINAGFQALRQFLPQRSGEKLSKAAILQQTAELIQTLKLEKERGADDPLAPLDRPQCKRRRMDGKAPENQKPEQSSAIPDASAAEYLRIIDELRMALDREQQLRFLYERKFTELRTQVLNNLHAAASSIGELPGRNDAQLNSSPLIRSHSAESPAIKAAFRELPSTAPSTPIGNFVAAAEAAMVYNNAVLNAAVKQQQQQPNNASRLSGLLAGLPDARFANAAGPLSLQNPLPALQLQNAFGGSLPLSSALNCAANGAVGPLTPHPSPGRNPLAVILDAIRQLDGEHAKNFVSDGLAADVLVR
ncbi:BHLH domain-containing protein [Aphelenchoides fujianensis]|nr:BHLH domain-containing protein [Aphelenchoides fujianensis]